MTPRFELAAPTSRQTAHCSCSTDSTTRHRSPRASTSVPAQQWLRFLRHLHAPGLQFLPRAGGP